TSKHPTFVKKTTDMKTTLTAHPSKVDSKQTPETKPEIKTETKTGTGTTTITTTSKDETGKIIEEMRINYTEKSVAIILKSMYNVLKIKYPTIEPLNDEEKEILGELWTPAFQKYLADKYFILIMPIFASIALISPKIVKAKKANKKSKEQIENEIKKLEKKKLELENKGTKNGSLLLDGSVNSEGIVIQITGYLPSYLKREIKKFRFWGEKIGDKFYWNNSIRR
ncbi:hypothetical protein LCGC14_1039710, partial [marine sediment metagenome]